MTNQKYGLIGILTPSTFHASNYAIPKVSKKLYENLFNILDNSRHCFSRARRGRILSLWYSRILSAYKFTILNIHSSIDSYSAQALALPLQCTAHNRHSSVDSWRGYTSTLLTTTTYYIMYVTES